MRRIYSLQFLAALAVCASLCLLVAADKDSKDDSDKKEAKSDKDAIQGTWKCVKMQRDGKEEAEDQVKEHALTVKFDGEAITYQHDREGQVEKKHGTFKLDTEKKPKRITVTPKDDPNQDKPLVGIYDLKGDTLKVAHRHGDDADTLPEDFKGGDGIVIMTLERQKDGDKDKDDKAEKK